MVKAIKDKKIRCFYTETILEKPNKKQVRHFIHSASSGGFWAHIRDISQCERLTNDAVGHQTVVVITIGYNPCVLDLWEKLIIVDECGTTYKIKEKPDEYEYRKGDIKFNAYAFRDDTVYSEDDVYDF